MEKGAVNTDKSFVSNNKGPEITYPRKGAFNFPSFSIPSEFSSILCLRFFSIFSVRTNQLYSPFFKLFTKWIAIITFISNQALWAAFRPSRALSWYFDLFKRLVNKSHLRRGCRGNGASQRNTLAVDHHHPLRTFTSLGFSDAGAPFFAGAKLPSMKASSQSKSAFSSSSERNLRQTSSQTPCSSHSLSLRQHVEGLGYTLGRSLHLAPLRKTQRMPSKTCRLPAGGRPTRPGFGLGNKGSSLFHCSSFINRVVSAIGSPPIAYYTKIYKKSSFLTSCNNYILCWSVQITLNVEF